MRWSLVLMFMGCVLHSFSQKVFTVEYDSQADVKLFVVEYASQADLCVFKVDYASRAVGNEGHWFWTDYASQAEKKVFFVALLAFSFI